MIGQDIEAKMRARTQALCLFVYFEIRSHDKPKFASISKESTSAGQELGIQAGTPHLDMEILPNI